MEKRHIKDIRAEDLYLKIGLYEDILHDDFSKVMEYLGAELTFDSYCCECQKDGTFKSRETDEYRRYRLMETALLGKPANSKEDSIQDTFQYIARIFSCARNENHRLIFMFKTDNEKVIKIGQHPSIADLQKADLRKYRPVLSKDYLEFATAIKIQSNGVGIGSFVYLRRIVERLIEEAHIKKSTETDWDEDTYKRAKVGGKIDMLKGTLDEDAHEILKPLYGILSKGIHELDEEECLKYFGDFKIAIEFILDGKLAQHEREQKKKRVTSAVHSIASSQQ